MRWQCSYYDSKGIRCENEALHRVHFSWRVFDMQIILLVRLCDLSLLRKRKQQSLREQI